MGGARFDYWSPNPTPPMRLPLLRVTWALALSSALLASAKLEDWKDPQGATFKAEPVELLGPFALFRTSSDGGRRLPLRALSLADCVRVHQQLGNKAEAAAKWSDATGELTGRLRGFLRRYEGISLLPVDMANWAEPRLLFVFYVDNSASGAWDMLAKSIAPYQAIQERFPGQTMGIQFGAYHGQQEHGEMALRSKVPWLLVDFEEQRRITTLFRLSPGRGKEFALFALTRDGVPVFGMNNPDEAAITQFFTDADALLGLLRPGNPLVWQDRAHYLSALRAEEHKQDSAGPLLVGDPLVARTLKNLRERGIARVEAKIEVGADGKVTAATLKEDPAISAKAAAELGKALQQYSVFAPAVDHGQLVAGTYDYAVDTGK